MTTADRFDRYVEDLLGELAEPGYPAYLDGAIATATARAQRGASLFPRLGLGAGPGARSMRLVVPIAVVTALVVGLLSFSLFGGPEKTPDASRNTPDPNQATLPVSIDELTGQIYFARAGGQFGDERPFVVDADGTDDRAFVASEIGGPIRVSPDGRHILFNGDFSEGGPLNGAIAELPSVTFVALPDLDPTLNLAPQAWSPDGGWIVYEGWDDADPARNGLYKARYPGGEDLQQLTSSPGGGIDTPADWSGNGEIVFYRHVAGPAWDQGGSLWIVKDDGTNARPLPTPDVAPSWWVRWSPDASKLLFASARLSDQGAIWTIEPDGTSLTKVFEQVGDFPVTPTWSPDGRHIVFALDPIADEWTHPMNTAYVVRADGTGLTELIGRPDHKREFEWVDAPYVDSVVGTWRRTQTCQQVLEAFRAAGLESQTRWINAGFFPESEAPTGGDLCEGAAGPLEHSHFFTRDGQFGSRDEGGRPVDDGDYVFDPNTGALRFPSHSTEFGYAGDIVVLANFMLPTQPPRSVVFEVLVPDDCAGACATAHAWALSAFASGPWGWARS